MNGGDRGLIPLTELGPRVVLPGDRSRHARAQNGIAEQARVQRAFCWLLRDAVPRVSVLSYELHWLTSDYILQRAMHCNVLSLLCPDCSRRGESMVRISVESQLLSGYRCVPSPAAGNCLVKLHLLHVKDNPNSSFSACATRISNLDPLEYAVRILFPECTLCTSGAAVFRPTFLAQYPPN
jgi:hypothetical protein